MAIQTAYNHYFTIATTPGSTALVDLSARVTMMKVNMPQASNEAQAAGNTHKVYRPGAGDPSIECTFRSDNALLNVNQVLRQHLGIASTGFTIAARPVNAIRSSTNPEFGGEFLISGDLAVMDDSWGEVPSIGVKFVPFGTFSVTVTTT